MGLLSLLKEAFFQKTSERPKIKAKCPKCKADVNTQMERCPSCGTHIESMFRIKCEKCGAANKLEAKKCEKCGQDLYKYEPGAKQIYYCPICGYRADFYMIQCPACGTKFV